VPPAVASIHPLFSSRVLDTILSPGQPQRLPAALAAYSETESIREIDKWNRIPSQYRLTKGNFCNHPELALDRSLNKQIELMLDRSARDEEMTQETGDSNRQKSERAKRK